VFQHGQVRVVALSTRQRVKKGDHMPLLLIVIILLLLLGGGAAWALEGILRIILLVILAVLIVGLIARMGRAAS
jgi:hypothetical protein